MCTLPNVYPFSFTLLSVLRHYVGEEVRCLQKMQEPSHLSECLQRSRWIDEVGLVSLFIQVDLVITHRKEVE